MNLPREISLDKVRTWKPFHKLTQERLASHMLLNKNSKDKRNRFGELKDMNVAKVGYEVYADGPTRVLRICEFSNSHNQDKAFHSCAKIRMRVSQLGIQLLEQGKEVSPPSLSLWENFIPSMFETHKNLIEGNIIWDCRCYNYGFTCRGSSLPVY